MMRRRIVPNEQLGHLWPHATQGFYEGQAIVRPAPLANQLDQFSRLDMERAMQHPPPVAPADEDHLLLAPPGPCTAQWRELTQGRLIPYPDFAACRPDLLDSLNQRPFFSS